MIVAASNAVSIESPITEYLTNFTNRYKKRLMVKQNRNFQIGSCPTGCQPVGCALANLRSGVSKGSEVEPPFERSGRVGSDRKSDFKLAPDHEDPECL